MTDTTPTPSPSPSPAPLRFALVSADMTPQMVDAYHDNVDSEGPQTLWWRIVEASPGNDLLQRIVKELNSAHALALNTGFRKSADRIDALLNELGGGHG